MAHGGVTSRDALQNGGVRRDADTTGDQHSVLRLKDLPGGGAVWAVNEYLEGWVLVKCNNHNLQVWNLKQYGIWM